MKQLDYNQERSLFNNHPEAWGAWQHWKYAGDKTGVEALMRDDMKEAIRAAFRLRRTRNGA